MGTRSIRTAIAAPLLVAVTAVATVVVAGGGPSARAGATVDARSREAIHLRNRMRKLWEDHIVWTRQVIVSSLVDLPDADAAVGRLLFNQDAIGRAIEPYYGKRASARLTELLRDHIVIAAELLHAAKDGDQARFEDARVRWYANGREIADFLHRANPRNWSRREMRSMMSEHLDLTLAEASARLNSDWEADVQAYDRIHRQILRMADMLSLGIIAQFPDRF